VHLARLDNETTFLFICLSCKLWLVARSKTLKERKKERVYLKEFPVILLLHFALDFLAVQTQQSNRAGSTSQQSVHCPRMMPGNQGFLFGFQSKAIAQWELADVQAWIKAGAAKEAGWEKKLSTGG
jgi:hypothetical protein